MLMMIGLAAALFVVLPVVFAFLAILMAVHSGAAVLFAAGALAGKGILPGIVLGYILYRTARKNRTAGEAK